MTTEAAYLYIHIYPPAELDSLVGRQAGRHGFIVTTTIPKPRKNQNDVPSPTHTPRTFLMTYTNQDKEGAERY